MVISGAPNTMDLALGTLSNQIPNVTHFVEKPNRIKVELFAFHLCWA